jgi:hypothetical protein
MPNPLEEHIEALVEDIGLEELLDLCDFSHVEAAQILIMRGYMELPYEWRYGNGEDMEE